MLVSDSIPALINGVSQQPSTLRLPSQVSEQINAYSSEVDGLRKRPPLIHSAKLADDTLGAAHLHAINRDADEKYDVFITNGDLYVFDKDGVQKTVNFPNGKGYLDCGAADPIDAFRAVSVADYTFVANRTKTVTLLNDLSPTRPAEALVVVKQGSYGKRYRVVLDLEGALIPPFIPPFDPDTQPEPPPIDPAHVEYTYQTPNGDQPDEVYNVGTDYIALKLANGLRARSNTLGSGFVLTVYGSVVHITHPLYNFTVKVTDEFGNNGATAYKGRTQRFSSLPSVAQPGFYIEVIGDETTAFDNFYVSFEPVSQGDGTGVWREVVKAGIKYKLDRSTMPHVLVREADGTFTFKQAGYKDRTAGDDETAPPPSFVGRQIADMFLYRNRLGFLSDENVILSGASDLFNFWPETVATVLDDAPIDLSVTTNDVSLLRSVALFSKRLILFSDKAQIEFQAGDVITPRSVATDTVAKFESEASVRPAESGTGTFFIQTAGKYSRLRELIVTDDGVTLDANDVTNHAPAYVPAGIHKITASTTLNLVAMLSKQARNRLYLYKYHYDGRQKLQSALFHWELPETYQVLDAQFRGTDLRLVYTVDGQGTFAGYFPLATDAADPDATYLTHLDRRVDETLCTCELLPASGGLPDRTKVILPLETDGRTTVVTRSGDDIPGEVAAIIERSVDYLIVEGDYTTRKFFVGSTYDTRVRLSPILLRRSSGESSVPILGGRLQLRYITVKYAGTGLFYVRVTPRARPTYAMASTGRLVGATVLNEISVLPDGFFRFPVQCRNTDAEIELLDSTHLPARFQSLEWEGFYTTRDGSPR